MSSRPVFSVILAGGRGTRMRSSGVHKVCSEVGGVPVILRSLATYRECGIENHIIVVGEQGEQVLNTVGPRVPNVSLVYQPEPLGTGHATRCGVASLQGSGYEGDILVVMGDRVLAPQALRKLMAAFAESGADLALLVGSKSDNPSSGRVVFDLDSQSLVIVETSDIALSRLAAELSACAGTGEDTLPCDRVMEIVRGRFSSEKKAQVACGPLYDRLLENAEIDAGQLADLAARLGRRAEVELERGGERRRVPASDVEGLTDDANLATYMFRAPVLFDGLATLDRENAQGEEYLTDAIRNITTMRDDEGRPRCRTVVVRVDDGDDALAFNTSEELARIERRLRLRSTPAAQLVERPRVLHDRSLRPFSEWHMLFGTNAEPVTRFMLDTYGPNRVLHEAKRAEYLRALEGYGREFGLNDKVFIVRSPGRLNLMGRHIDHRGGFTNVVAISEEILMVGSPRDDDVVELHNTKGSDFAHGSFAIGQHMEELAADSWLALVNGAKALAAADGHWQNYIKAAALRLQERYREIPLRGANIVTHGTIPIGSGLSSSSAIVVGAAEALVAVNSLPVHANLLVDLCGEGEWFVGTRGGAGDHAAIKFGRRGSIVHLGFLPFTVSGTAPFPAGHSIVVCNSGIEAKKAGGARETFNQKVLGYVVGEIIVKRLHPEHAERIRHLRDINCANLGIELADLYGMLKQIPEQLTRSELEARFGPFSGEERGKLDNLLGVLRDKDAPFAVRGPMLFGLAECERSAMCIDYLEAGDTSAFGELWYTSHDGDRVVSHDLALREAPWGYTVDDAYLDGLISALQEGGPEAASARLALQPGQYACSTPEIDLIVDVARSVPGVKGAQMAGAGLGGCVMVLVEDEASADLIERIAEQGFQASRYELVEGAGLVLV